MIVMEPRFSEAKDAVIVAPDRLAGMDRPLQTKFRSVR